LLTVACALLFSLAPAFEARRNRHSESLSLATARIAAGRHIGHKALVVSEVAISLVLLFAAALLLNSFWALNHTRPGFESRNVITLRSSFSAEQYATTALLSQHLDELTTQLEGIPGVESAAAANSLPTQLTAEIPCQIPGRRTDQQGDLNSPKYMPITAHYFHVLHVPVIAGRTFTESDTHGSMPVAIINRKAARTGFKGDNPIGQHILAGAVMGPEFQDSAREIIGVVEDVKQDGLNHDAPPIVYFPAAQIPDSMTKMEANLLGMSWLVRYRPGQGNIASQAQRIFMCHAHAPLLSVESLTEVVGASIAQRRFNTLVPCGFGMISLALGAAGLYGVMSYTVAQRTKEIGVRMALGARRGDIRSMVLREAGLLVGLGLLAGIVGALTGERLLHSMFVQIHEGMPITLAFACGALLFNWTSRGLAPRQPSRSH